MIRALVVLLLVLLCCGCGMEEEPGEENAFNEDQWTCGTPSVPERGEP